MNIRLNSAYRRRVTLAATISFAIGCTSDGSLSPTQMMPGDGVLRTSIGDIPTNVAISPSPVPMLAPGASVQLSTRVTSSTGVVLTRFVTWSSTNTAVATVSAQGVVVAVAAGTANVRGSVTDWSTGALVTGIATITVQSGAVIPIKSIVVALGNVNVAAGATTQASATLKDSLGRVLTGRTVTWTSSSASIASVNATTGVVTGVAAGTSVITATSGSVTGTATITISLPTVRTIAVNLSSASIAPGATAQATATLKDSLGQAITGRTVSWTSATPSVATVNGTTGIVTGVAAGTSSITATNGSVTGSTTITVAVGSQGSPIVGARVANGPTSFINSAYVAPSANAHVYHVAAGQSIQARIDSARPGDVILIAAGATFIGPFTLKPKTGGTAPIIIRSDTPDALLPAEGTRITPASSAKLPRLVGTTAYNYVVTTVPRAANYRLMFLEVAPVTGNDMNTLVRLGSSNADQPVIDSVPSNIVLDRVYLHGLPTNNLIRCVQIHGQNIAIVDSYLTEAHANLQDSQAIVGWNGPGPYKIVNNFLAASGENVMFGGADPLIPGMIASDIEMKRNHVWKDPAWKGSQWSVKNHLEFKVGQRAVIEGNIFENNWPAAQSGLSILIKSTNQSGGFTGAVSRDIIFRSNIIRNVASGIAIAARPDGPAIPANLIWVVNNIFEQISPGSTAGIGIRLSADLKNIVVQNNTLLFAPGGGITSVQFDHAPFPLPDSLALANNVFMKATGYGVMGLDGGGGEGAASLATYHATYRGNVINGVTVPQYPTAGGNSYPTSIALVYPGWQSYIYLITSLFHNAGTDGKDPGADILSVAAATLGVP